jgi:O-antigen/teichoic acid export membrane protein
MIGRESHLSAARARWIGALPVSVARFLQRMQSDSGRGRLTRAASWNVLGGSASRLGTLLASFWIARSLGREGLGELGVVLTTCTTISVFASFGLGTTATRFISMNRDSDPHRAGRIAVLVIAVTALLSTAVSTGVLIWSTPLASSLLDAPGFAPYLRLAIPILVLGALQETIQGVLAGLEAFRSVAKTSAITGISQALGMVAGARWGHVSGCICGAVLGSLIGVGCASIMLRAEVQRRGFDPDLRNCRREWGPIWRFALPAVLVGGVVMLAHWMSMVFLVRSRDGADQMGLFTAANQWRNAILYVPNLIASAGLPVLTQLWNERSGTAYVRAVRFKFLIGLLSSAGIAAPIVLLSGFIFRGYGNEFSGGPIVLAMLAGSAVLASSANMLGQAIVGEGRMWTGLAVNLIWASVLIALADRWIPSGGALGLAQANLASFAVYLVMLGCLFLMAQRRGTPDPTH